MRSHRLEGLFHSEHRLESVWYSELYGWEGPSHGEPVSREKEG